MFLIVLEIVCNYLDTNIIEIFFGNVCSLIISQNDITLYNRYILEKLQFELFGKLTFLTLKDFLLLSCIKDVGY